MVAAHARVAHTAEGYVLIGNVHDGVVDTGTARGGVADDVPSVGLAAKVVKGQRLLAVGDVAGNVLYIIKGENGEYGAEDFLGEHLVAAGLGIGIGIAEADVHVEQGGLDETLVLVGAPAIEDVALGEVALDTGEGAVAHHAHIVAVLLDVGAVKLAHGLGKLLDEGLLHLLVDEQVVGRYAGLPRVEGLAPRYTLGGGGNVGRAVYDAGALAAELEHHGREVPRGGLHHDLAQRGTAGEEDEVEAVGEQGLVDVAVAQHDGDVLRVEGVFDHLTQHARYGGHVGRGFQYGGAPGRDGAHEGVEQQLHGVVPRGHDERVAQWLAHDVAARGKHLEGRTLAAALAPAAEVAQVVGNLATHDAELGEVGLFVRLVEVGPQRIGQWLFPFGECCLQLL